MNPIATTPRSRSRTGSCAAGNCHSPVRPRTPPALHRSVFECRYPSLMRSLPERFATAPCSGKSTTGSWNTIAFFGRRRSIAATNAPSECQSFSRAFELGMSAGDAWSSTPPTSTTTSNDVNRSRGRGQWRRRIITRTRSSKRANTTMHANATTIAMRFHARTPCRPTSSSGRLSPPFVPIKSAAITMIPSRASSVQPPRSERSERAHEHDRDRDHEADRGRESELGGAEALAAGFVQMVRKGGERPEPVLGHRAQAARRAAADTPRRLPACDRARRAGSARAASGRAASAGSRRTTSRARPRRRAAASTKRPGRRRASALTRRADREEREEEREVVDAGDTDEHRAEQEPAHAPPRGAVPQLGNRRQRGVGTEHLRAQHDDHGYADVEREVLVRGAVAEVVRREREQHRAHERRRPRTAQRRAAPGTRRARRAGTSAARTG